MKKTLLFIFTLLTLSLSAQDIKFDALSNGGGRISNVNSASFTFGQPFVGSITNGTNSIRQGFQQPSFMMSVPGCTDSSAFNYNPLATIDDGSCIPFIYGCTDITACTYDILSNTDDGSCLYLDIFGICGGNNTIQMAIDSASPGDIINIPLGTYTEFLVINKSITLNAQAGVLLNVAGHTTGILIDDSTSDVTINSLTITGDNLTGSAITVNPGTHNITITNNIISSILLPGGGNASPLSYGILCWGNPSTGVNPPTNITITGNTISYVLGSAISLGTNTDSVSISGNTFSNIIPVAYSTTYLAVGIQAELSNVLDINNNTYDGLLQANNLANCTNTTISGNTYSNSPLMLNTTYPHIVSFNDTPWWNLIYATSPTDYFQAYYSDTNSVAYQSLVATYASFGTPIWATLSSSNPGCTDTLALNYNSAALSNNGSCIMPVYGCMDSTMFNFNPLANTDDASCIPFMYGCMDSTMFNYSGLANTDDGTCIPFIYACIDSTMLNFDPLANTDDGSCTPFIYGCTNPLAPNYNLLANTDDGSCLAYVYGCTDSTAYNYDTTATLDDGSCSYCDYMDNDYISDVYYSEISCNGSNDGSIFGIDLGTLILYNGTGPFTYSVDSGLTFQSSTTFSNLSAGNYYVTYMDANGCINPNTSQYWLALSEPDSMQFTTSQNDVSCNGGNDGDIMIDVQYVNYYPYNLQWSDGSTDSVMSNVTAGNYNVVITDANNCTDTVHFNISEPIEIATSISTSNVSCVGGNDGTAVTTISGGQSPYTFNWSNGATTTSVNNLTEGSHFVVVTDANNCSDTSFFDINSNPITVTYNITEVSCISDDGAIDITVSGGQSPYSFDWQKEEWFLGWYIGFQNFSSNEDLSGLESGDYLLTITDDNGCTYTDTISVDTYEILAASVVTDVSCYGGNDGSIDLTASAGVTPYSYLWNNGSTSEDISGLSAGTYDVNIIDNNGCSIYDTVLVSEAAEFLVNANITNDVSNCDGAIDITVNGATPPYTYDWQNANLLDTFNVTLAPASTAHPYYGNGNLLVYLLNGVEGDEITLLRGYTYYFIMDNVISFFPFYISTDVVGGSNYIGEVINGVTNSGAINYETLTFTPDASHPDTLYYQSATTGYMGYRIILSDGNNSEDLTNICAGDYNLLITDANDCLFSATYNVNDALYGCTDSTMYNYNPLANINDGSCIAFVYGCMDSTMFNYNANATADDGSCIAFVYGCMDSIMFNYDVLANTDDGSCISFIYGCTDPTMFNYDVSVNTDDGSCISFVYGCMDSTMFNYDVLANTDDGSCIAFVYGCTDSTQFNYNAFANTDDGSCIAFVYGCMDSTATNYDVTANTDDGSCTNCYAVADIGADTITACDSVLISTNLITNGSYLWNSSNISLSFSPAIGDSCQGGLVFYLDGNGGGLISATSDQSSSTQWGCYGTNVSGAYGTAIGTGYQNTIAGAGCSGAAALCINLTLGGYSDWFLPSKDELNQMYLNIGQGNALGLGNIGGFANGTDYQSGGHYWSSTEHSNQYAWNQQFHQYYSPGNQTGYKKYNGRYVRAIRSVSSFVSPNIDTTNNITVSTSGWNYVTVTDSLGCTATDSVYVQIDICGCTDPTALNYNPSATSDDGSCIATVFGCMDPTAMNYDALANTDDGGCISFVYGCMDSTQFNYNALANTDDGSCMAIAYGCTDSLALNFDPLANTDDGSCCGAGISLPPFGTQIGQDIDGEAAGDYSGYSVSMSSDGNTVAIGAPDNDGNASNSGHVRIYNYNGGSWVQLGQDITGIGQNADLGKSVSINNDGTRLAIGSPGNNPGGSVRIYSWDGIAWILLGAPIDGDPGTDMGKRVSLSNDGNIVAIGSGGYHPVKTYIYNGVSWTQLGQDIVQEVSLNYHEFSTVSLSSDGYTLAIGSPDNSGNGDHAGHVRIYSYDGSSWIQMGSDIDGEYAYARCGISISLSSDGNILAIGATGDGTATRIYDWNGISWNQLGNDIDGEGTIDLDGYSVSLSSDGNTIAIGAPQANYSSSGGAGQVRIYKNINGTWTQQGTDIDGEAAGDFSGASVSLSSDGNTVAIGAYQNDGDNNNWGTGHVRVFSLGGTGYTSPPCSGCTDSLAVNYDPYSLIDDGTCDYLGCTDSLAFNYDPMATLDDSSCIASVYGCTDPTAMNYDPLANTDDGTCIPYVYGCIDSTATNYDVIANTDDGSCTYCYAVADIGADSITACDSALISANTITNSSYCWQNDSSINLQQWGYLGTPNFSTASVSGFIDMKINNGIPYVAFQDASFSNKVTVMKFENNQWNVVGYPGFSLGEAQYMSLDFYQNTPYIAYRDEGNSNRASVKKYENYSWVDVGPLGTVNTSAKYTSLSIDQITGIPYLALTGSADYAKVITYDGSNWVYVGSQYISTIGSNPTYITLVVDNGVKSFAFTSDLGGSNYSHLSVMEFDGTNWQYLGNTGFSNGSANRPELIVNNGVKYVTFGSQQYGYAQTVMEYNGSQWVSLGNPLVSTGEGQYGRLIFSDNIPYVAHTSNSVNNYSITVKKYYQGQWVDIGNNQFSPNSSSLSLAVDDNGVPHVAFKGANPYQVSVMRISNLCESTTNNITVTNSGWNYVTVTDSLGCTATDSVYVHIDICGCMDPTAVNYNPTATSDDGSCIPCIYGCMDSTAYNYSTAATCDDGSCIPFIFGCIDNTAYNYDSTANINDGSCQYCDLSLTLFPTQNSSPTACDGAIFSVTSSSNNPIIYAWNSGQTNYFITGLCSDTYILTVTDDVGCSVSDSVVIGSPVIYGCTDPSADNYDATATVDDGSCTYPPVSGCTDPSAGNYDPSATVDDGSCTSPSCNEDAPTGLFVDGIIHSRAVINWDNMNSSTCTVDQYRIRYRVAVTSGWTNKTMGGPLGSCTWGNQRIDKLLLGLTGSTTYEYQMKAWYCGGGASSWTSLHNFTTADNCPNVGNLAAYGATPTKATFTWDDSNGPYEFVRLKSRIDSISNPTGSDWFQIGGSGVSYGTFTKNKNGLNPGETYRAQARAFCDPNGGAYFSLSWSPLVYWTQPVVRVEGGTAIANLDVYPNPSRDVFNISFTSEAVQDLKVRILNVVGEVIISEDLDKFIGEYTKQINLHENAKGIYFLEIETNDGVVNKKLILQ